MHTEAIRRRRSRNIPNPFDVLNAWTERAQQRRQLASLDAHILNDVGIRASDRDRECRKPFWRA